ncbi:MAG: hypothetical protein J6A53_05020 [Clostridia bacterium]|nr:hypothetical protein [Clostridia bacterium]
MHTIMSWHLPATREASFKSFFNTVESWMREADGSFKYKMDIPSPLYSIGQGCNISIEGIDATLKIICAEDEEFQYSSFLLIRKRTKDNFTWNIECVFKQSKAPDNSSYFVFYLRKNIIDTHKSFKYVDNTSLRFPRIIEMLIKNGLATKEKGEDFISMLEPSCEQLALIEKNDMCLYPVVYVNSSVASGYDMLLTYHSICHIVKCDSNEGWAYKIVFPRLEHTRTFNNDSIDDVIDLLFLLVNEGVSNASNLDYREVMRIYERGQLNKKTYISKALAHEIQAARKRKGLTQGELADLIISSKGANAALNGLLISRIESLRLKRIENDKLNIIEECLDIPNGYLASLASKIENEELPINSFNERANFCMKCGKPLPASEDSFFCQYCGKKLSN